MSERFDATSQARVVWMLALLILLGVGVGMIWWPGSTNIARVRGDARRLYEQANADEAEVRRAHELRAAWRRVTADIRQLSGANTATVTTTAALRLLNEETRRYNVDVRSILPQNNRIAAGGLIGSDVAIGVRGRFRDVVGLIADLPRHDVLMRLHDVSIVLGPPTLAGDPPLEVSIRATIYRLPKNLALEDVRDSRTVR